MTTATTTGLAPTNMISVTDAAAARIKSLIAVSETPISGVRVSVKQGGCSGFTYELEFAEHKGPLDDAIEDKGVTIFVDPTALMFVIGSEMDYSEDKFAGAFTFKNPNAIAECGCGESFTVDRETLAKLKAESEE